MLRQAYRKDLKVPERAPLTALAGLPYTEDAEPWLRLYSAILLTACADARDGDYEAQHWLRTSGTAADMADALELPSWPPTLEEVQRLQWFGNFRDTYQLEFIRPAARAGEYQTRRGRNAER